MPGPSPANVPASSRAMADQIERQVVIVTWGIFTHHESNMRHVGWRSAMLAITADRSPRTRQ
jgi:hypothetical protein